MNENPLQNTSAWYSDRLYHFTSSELHKLMTQPKSGTGLSKTAESYIFDKLAEELTAGTCLDYGELNTREVKWGHDYEPAARESYEQQTGQTVTLCGFIEWSKIFGGSPDGLVGDEGGIEIKCPYNSAVHARYLLLETPADLQRLKPEYYAQIQGNIMVCDRKWFDFVSYDPRVQNKALSLKILRIPRDDEFIERIRTALYKADQFKAEAISKLAKLCT